MCIVVGGDVAVCSLDGQTVLQHLLWVPQPTAHDGVALSQFGTEGGTVGHRVVADGVGGNGRERLLLAADIEYALAAFLLADRDDYLFMARRQHHLLVRFLAILPHLIIIYGIVIEETDNPFARLRVAPTAAIERRLLLVGRVGDVPYLKEVAGVTFYKVELPDVLGQRLEV